AARREAIKQMEQAALSAEKAVKKQHSAKAKGSRARATAESRLRASAKAKRRPAVKAEAAARPRLSAIKRNRQRATVPRAQSLKRPRPKSPPIVTLPAVETPPTSVATPNHLEDSGGSTPATPA